MQIAYFRKFSYSQRDIDDRNADCEEDPRECRDEEFFYTEINKEIEKNLHIGQNLSIVFIDSYARKEKNQDDPIQQDHFQENTRSRSPDPSPFLFKVVHAHLP